MSRDIRNYVKVYPTHEKLQVPVLHEDGSVTIDEDTSRWSKVCRLTPGHPELAMTCHCSGEFYRCLPNAGIKGYGIFEGEKTIDHSGFHMIDSRNGRQHEKDCVEACDAWGDKCAGYQWQKNYSGQAFCLLKTPEGFVKEHIEEITDVDIWNRYYLLFRQLCWRDPNKVSLFERKPAKKSRFQAAKVTGMSSRHHFDEDGMNGEMYDPPRWMA